MHVSFFQKRICSCMVEEKMTQCADPIDTQFNVLLSTWKKHVAKWCVGAGGGGTPPRVREAPWNTLRRYENATCSKAGCVCKEEGFRDISTREDLWAFIYRGKCAPKPDPSRNLSCDTTPHLQLAYACVTEECNEMGCLKDVLTRWERCPVQNKKGSEFISALPLP